MSQNPWYPVKWPTLKALAGFAILGLALIGACGVVAAFWLLGGL